MTIDMSGKNKKLTTEEILRREHSKLASARKVIFGAVPFEIDDNGDSVLPISKAVTTSSVSQKLDSKSAYRLISDVDIFFSMSNGNRTATTGDIYLPAKTSIVVQSLDQADTINIVGAAGGFAQLALLR